MTTATATSDYDVRMELCRTNGHTTSLWRLRIHGVLHVRLLCRVCSLTFSPIYGVSK